MGFPVGSDGKESACNAGDLGSIPQLGRSPEGGHGNPLQYSFLEDPHKQRNLVSNSPWGLKEQDTTERLKTYIKLKKIYDGLQIAIKNSIPRKYKRTSMLTLKKRAKNNINHTVYFSLIGFKQHFPVPALSLCSRCLQLPTCKCYSMSSLAS